MVSTAGFVLMRLREVKVLDVENVNLDITRMDEFEEPPLSFAPSMVGRPVRRRRRHNRVAATPETTHVE